MPRRHRLSSPLAPAARLIIARILKCGFAPCNAASPTGATDRFWGQFTSPSNPPPGQPAKVRAAVLPAMAITASKPRFGECQHLFEPCKSPASPRHSHIPSRPGQKVKSYYLTQSPDAGVHCFNFFPSLSGSPARRWITAVTSPVSFLTKRYCAQRILSKKYCVRFGKNIENPRENVQAIAPGLRDQIISFSPDL